MNIKRIFAKLSVCLVFMSLLLISSILTAKDIAVDIKAQKLGTALTELAKQSGVQIITSSEIGKNFESGVLKGEYSLEESLERLLANTPLDYKLIDDNSVLVETRSKLESAMKSNFIADEEESDTTEDIEADDENIITIVGKSVKRRDRTENIEPTLIYDVNFFQPFEPSTLQDMLKRVPGVLFNSFQGVQFVDSLGEIPERSNITFRGIAEGGGQILINGRRLPGGDSNTVDLENIPAEIIKEIRIIRSPTADINSQGSGLTINVILKDGDSIGNDQSAKWRTSLKSNNGEIEGELGFDFAGALTNNIRYFANITAADRSIFTENLRTDVQPGFPTSTQSVDFRSQVDSLSFNGSMMIDLENGDSLDLNAYIINNESEDLNANSRGGEIFESVESLTDTKTSGLGALYELPFWQEQVVNIDLSYSKTDLEAFSSNLPVYGPRFDSNFAQDREEIKLDVKFDLFLTETQSLKVGFTVEDTKQNNINNSPAIGTFVPARISDTDREEKGLDLFASYSIRLTENLHLQLGNRYESTDYKTTSAFEDFGFGLYYSPLLTSGVNTSEVDNSANNPSLNLKWVLADDHQLRFSFAKTVNLPTADLLSPVVTVNRRFSDINPGGGFEADTGAVDLEPEESKGFDLSYDYSFAESGLLGLSVYSKKLTNQFGSRPITDRNQIEIILPNLDELEDELLSPGEEITVLNIPFNNDSIQKTNGAEMDFSFPMDLIGLSGMNITSNISYFEQDSLILGDPRLYQASGNLTFDHNLESLGMSYGFSYNVTTDQKGAFSSNSVYGLFERRSVRDRGPSMDIFVQKRFSDSFLVRFNVANVLDSKDVTTSNINDDGDRSISTRTTESNPTLSLTVRGSF